MRSKSWASLRFHFEHRLSEYDTKLLHTHW